MKQQEHIFDIHVMRAVGCLMVVLVHVSALYYTQRGEWEDVILFLNQASRFGTPVFAIVSGILLCLQVKYKGFFFKRFFTSRLKKIVIPFLFWTAFYLFYLWLVFGANPFDEGIKRFIFKVAFGDTYSHLYFISVVLQFYLIFPVLQFVKSKAAWLILLILSAVIHVYAVKFMEPGQFDGLLAMIVEQRAFLPKWIFFFVFGGFLAYNWEAAKQWAYKWRIGLFVGVLLILYFAAVEYEWGRYIGSNRVSNILNLPILILFIMAISEKIARNSLLHFIASKLGTMSMGVYLIHPFVINMLQRNLPEGVWTLSLFPLWYVVVLAITVGIILLVQKLPLGRIILTVPSVKKIDIRKESVHKGLPET